MIKEYNNKSLALGLPGFVLQFAGLLLRSFRPELAMLGSALLVLGTAMLMGGLGYYAMAKGQHPAWCLMAFLSLLGFIVLGLLPDRSAAEQRADAPTAPHDFNPQGVCRRCGCGRSAAHRPCRS